MRGAVSHGCGQCSACRINRRRLWSTRMLLESLCHPSSSFVTLTYKQESLPPNASLVPKDAQDWLKRLRQKLVPTRVRFFLCGEYGDQTQRPHYHACLFGAGLEIAPIIQSTWLHGFAYTAEFNVTTAQYVAGYVVKKMTSKEDLRLNGRHPEFARMSLRPGLGAAAMSIISHQLHSEFGLDEVSALGDVPRHLTIGKKKLSLGRYLREQLRKEMGFTPEMVDQVKARFAAEKSAEVLLVLKGALSDPSFKGGAKQALVARDQGRIWSIEARSKLNKGKKL